MSLEEGKNIYQVFIGTKQNGLLRDPVIAGHGIHYVGDDHYVLKLMMIPNVSYFLAKNPSSQATYTVFTKCLRSGDRLRFQNPVGFARLSDDLKTHLEIEFPLLKTSVYMSLFPKHFQKGA